MAIKITAGRDLVNGQSWHYIELPLSVHDDTGDVRRIGINGGPDPIVRVTTVMACLFSLVVAAVVVC